MLGQSTQLPPPRGEQRAAGPGALPPAALLRPGDTLKAGRYVIEKELNRACAFPVPLRPMPSAARGAAARSHRRDGGRVEDFGGTRGASCNSSELP
eukprot:365844-Chlamydomonas_euryale.AAC.12